jgi:hypothetical protein
VGRVTSPEEAKVATGYAGTGAERLRGPGDFIAVVGGQVTRFQAAYISPRELAEVVQAMLHSRYSGPVHNQLEASQPAGKPVRYLKQAATQVRRQLEGSRDM